METRNRGGIRGALAAGLAVMLWLVCAPSALASTTIGQLPPVTPPPTATCNANPNDLGQPTVSSGNSYVVPTGGAGTGAATITSWSTFAMAGSGQQLEMKIFRHVTGIGDPNVYQVVGSDGPRSLTPSVLNTFPTNIAVRPGDFLGINTENANPGPPNTACYFSAPGDAFIVRAGNLPDGGTGDFAPVPDFRLNLTAVVGFQPANEFSFGKTTRNRNKGTAKLVVSVPGPGTLTLTGKGVKAQRPARDAVASKVVTAAGKVSLTIRPKGKAKQKLNKTGKAKVKVKVTYTPKGDLPGVPKTQSKRVKLVKTG